MLIGIDMLDETSALERFNVASVSEDAYISNGFAFDLDDYHLGGGEDRLLTIPADTLETSTPVSRWDHLYLASLGARVFSNHLSEDSPLYGGKVPTSVEEVRRAVISGRFADGRAQYFASFGVNYIGRAHLSPRNIIVLDNKNGSPLNRVLDDTLESLYGSLPDDWWGSCGFVSTGNVDKLGAFLEAVPEAVVLAYSDGARAKLKYLNVDHAVIDLPYNDAAYGISVREKANRLSYDLSFK